MSYNWCKELAPLTGHEHYHCFIYYDNPKTFSSLQKRLFGANIQVAKGTVEQIKAYCSKDGKFLYEEGEVPHQGSQRVIASEVKKMTTEEVIETYGKSALTILKVRDLLNAKININDWHKEVKVFILQVHPVSARVMQLRISLSIIVRRKILNQCLMKLNVVMVIGMVFQIILKLLSMMISGILVWFQVSSLISLTIINIF